MVKYLFSRYCTHFSQTFNTIFMEICRFEGKPARYFIMIKEMFPYPYDKRVKRFVHIPHIVICVANSSTSILLVIWLLMEIVFSCLILCTSLTISKFSLPPFNSHITNIPRHTQLKSIHKSFVEISLDD